MVDRVSFISENYRRVCELMIHQPARLLVVSKNFSVEDILVVYGQGHREFAENYVQELLEKAKALPLDINWHFIGGLQSNKIALLLKCPSLSTIQTVDSIAKAEIIEKHCVKLGRQVSIFLQVNASKEPNKHGLHPSLVEDAAIHVQSNMKRCLLKGLMMIGSLEASKQLDGDNPEFELMVRLRDDIEKSTGARLELSMGMSHDYMQAIKYGSSMVRLGASIFGNRATQTTPNTDA